MEKFDFAKKVAEIQKQAQKHIEEGPITDGYQGDRATILKLLNDSLATEIVCVLRYKVHYEMAEGIHSEAVAAEFLDHAKTEQEHVDELAERISQLGGTPDYNPATLVSRSITKYETSESLIEMIKEDLIAERIVIGAYSEMIRYIGNTDPTTRRMLEHILAEEEEHADDLAKMLSRVRVEDKSESKTQAA